MSERLFVRGPAAAGLVSLVCHLALAVPPAALADEPEAPAAASTEAPSQEAPAERFSDAIDVAGEASLTRPSPERAALAIASLPGGADFIDGEAYRNGRVSTLQDALAFAPGVFAQPRFGAEEARLSIRGSGLQRTFHGRGVRLLQDGAPLNLADGSFDFQAVEPLASRYVEVYRGAAGVGRGGATLGGAIDFISRTGHDGGPWSARVEGGSFGYLRAQASAGLVAGSVDGFAALHHYAQDGFRDHAVQDTQRLFGNLGWRHGDGVETRFYLTAVNTDSELPGALTRAQLDARPEAAAPGNLALDQRRDFDLLRLGVRTTRLLSSTSDLQLGGFWSAKNLDHPIFQVIDQRSDDFGVDLSWRREGELAGRRHRATLATTAGVGKVEDRRFVNLAGRRGAPTAEGETTSTGIDLYLEDRVELTQDLSLTAGLAASWAGREFEDRFLREGDQSDDQSFDGVSPKLALLWQAGADVTLFAAAARSFEPPTFGELVNVGGDGLLGLDPQRATTLELGSRGGRGRARWDAVFYSARVDGELLSLTDEAGNPRGTINADRTDHTGGELGLTLDLARSARAGGLRLRSAYTWSRFRFDGDRVFGDNRLAGLPEHYVRAELAWEHPRGMSLAPRVEWVPDGYPVDHANTLFTESYTALGLRLGWQGKRLSVFVDGRNLTDETYAATTGVLADARGRDAAQFFPGDGRSVFVGFEVRP